MRTERVSRTKRAATLVGAGLTTALLAIGIQSALGQLGVGNAAPRAMTECAEQSTADNATLGCAPDVIADTTDQLTE
ncbi:hypothetical protein ORI20_29380 [Mycobacterium sp. CVI_P3]|uniref:Secreted protein n=1 Tax=Mycobacterium pinniadriaticum TaxID=2994102 RepID=A0ABT3SMX5_9MYCO|nr:hypothetical protein [Mycobacterium pinniadriaticum]MCX2934385.1 hypothetical protein [Mycobacterium pinniadriaticum]MCX2940808.1 hypothetical protein [Mycobacterium pinniadriaticum]